MKNSRRGVILIEPYKQLKFGVMFLLLNFAFSMLILLIFGYYLWDVYDAVTSYFQLDAHQSGVTMAKFVEPLWVGSLLLLLFILATLFLSARYTHQIYGPMVSIRRFLDQLLRGEKPSAIKLRQQDQLQDLVMRLNQIAELQPQPQKIDSIVAVNQYIEALIRGGKPAGLHLADSDPLKPVEEQLERLCTKLQSNGSR